MKSPTRARKAAAPDGRGEGGGASTGASPGAGFSQRLAGLGSALNFLASGADLRQVLDVVTSNVAEVMKVRGVSVRLLSEDAVTLRFAAGHGLPQGCLDGQAGDMACSPLDHRIIEGETLVSGEIAPGSTSESEKALAALGIRSVLLTSLTVHNRVIGILSAYSDRPECFDDTDAGFFRLAADLSAVAIEHARRHEALQRMVGERLQFMFRFTHTLRAPLAAAISLLHLAREGYVGELQPRQLDHLERVGRRLRGLDASVGEILALTREPVPGKSMRREPVDIGELAERVEAAFREQAVQRGLAMRLVVAAGLRPVTGDAHLLGLVLENLVSNALKYTPAGGAIEVAVCSAAGEGVEVAVRDTGIGIPKAEQGRLFTELFRASNARKTEEAGTGLGLWFVRGVVETHGGQVTVESEEGRGTRVRVVLPLASPDPVAPPPGESKAKRIG